MGNNKPLFEHDDEVFDLTDKIKSILDRHELRCVHQYGNLVSEFTVTSYHDKDGHEWGFSFDFVITIIDFPDDDAQGDDEFGRDMMNSNVIVKLTRAGEVVWELNGAYDFMLESMITSVVSQ